MRKPTESDKNHDLHVIEQIVDTLLSKPVQLYNLCNYNILGPPPTKPVVIGISMDFTQRCACQGSKKDTQQKRYSLKPKIQGIMKNHCRVIRPLKFFGRAPDYDSFL